MPKKESEGNRYKNQREACENCQCHGCAKRETCRLRRPAPPLPGREMLPYPCQGCGKDGVYQPFVQMTTAAICQMYITL